MEQTLLMNHAGLQSLDSQIGVHTEDGFIIDDDCCLEALEEIQRGLDTEDRQTCVYRLQLYKYGIATKRLPAVLMSLDDENNDLVQDKEEIFFTVLRLLARLTQTLDVLVSDFPGKPQNPNSLQSQSDECVAQRNNLTGKIQTIVHKVKDIFLTTSIARVIIDKMLENSLCGKLGEPLCEALNSMFFLLRNLLYLPDQENKETEMYRLSEQLVRVLLECKLQKVVLLCTNSPQKEQFSLSLVQLVAALFNNARSPGDGGLGSLGTYTMSSICESEEDMSAEEVRQSETLQEFAKCLIEQGLPQMLYHIKTILLGGNEKNLSPLYYLWLLDFCLTRAVAFRFPFSTVRFLVSVYSVDYLAYLAVTSLEQMLLQQERGLNFSQSAMNLSLVIKGMSDFFSVLKYYSETDLPDEERQYLFNVQCLVCQSRELRQSILLLLRCHQPDVHGIGHLEALVSLNHSFLLMVERLVNQNQQLRFFDMGKHVKSYASQQVFQHYTTLISEPSDPSLTTIEQVFTMMYHVTMDLGQKHLLLHLPLMQAISALESSAKCHRLSKSSVRLMHFALEQFFDGMMFQPTAFFKAMVTGPSHPPLKRLIDRSTKEKDLADKKPNTGALQWTQSELEQLNDVCVECEDTSNFVESVIEEMRNLGLNKPAVNIIDQMTELEWLTDTETIEDANCDENDGDIKPLVETLVAKGYHEQLAWLQEVFLEIVYIKLGGLNLGRPAVEEPVIMNYMAQNQDIPLVAYTEEQETMIIQEDFSVLLYTIGLQNHADYIFPRIPQSWDVTKLLQIAESIQTVDYNKTKFTEEDVKLYYNKQSEFQDSENSFLFQNNKKSSQSTQSGPDADMWMLYVKSVNRTSKVSKGGQNTKQSWWKN